MMSYLRVPYEISLWEDRLTLVDSYGNEYDNFVPNVEIVASYYKEIKIATIGSNDSDFLGRAVEPQLKRNVNGTNTLIFSIYTKYFNESNQLCDNPFLPFLTNERKVKLRYVKKGKIKWLDFIIKSIEEDSITYKNTYTASDLFINELSKSGYKLQFNEQLENNYGTVNELGEKVLAGTDWQIGENTEIIQQFNEEALYEIVLNTDLGVKNITKNKFEVIPRGEKIYTFYSCVINKETDYFQFLYRSDGNYAIDEKKVVINADSYYLTFSNPENAQWPYFAQTLSYCEKFRGERLVKSPITLLDPVTNKIITVYKDREGREVYGYTESKYLTSGLVQNLIVNSQDFSSSSGWEQYAKSSLQVKMVPDYLSDPHYSGERQSIIKYTQDESNFLFNSGFELNQSIIGPIVAGEEYIARIKYKTAQNLNSTPNVGFNIQVKTYRKNEFGEFAKDPNEKVLFEGSATSIDSEGYIVARLSSNYSVSEQDLIDNKYGIFLFFDNAGKVYDIYLQAAQFFKKESKNSQYIYCPDGAYLKDLDGELIVEHGIESQVKTEYYYYYPAQNVTSEKEIQYISVGEENKTFTLKYNDNFEKIRSITASETNRFNLLQSLSEIFECWCRFEVLHKDTGEILLQKDIQNELIVQAGAIEDPSEGKVYDGGQLEEEANLIIFSDKVGIRERYRQQKFVTFHKYIGQQNPLDFVYGLNLKSIKRKVESNGVITKLIVKNNSNKFAETGSCSISRAKENPTGETFILNFDYYINQGLLNYENFYNDLYSINSERGWIGYYTRLKQINSTIQELIEEREPENAALARLSSDYETAKVQYDSNNEILRQQEELFHDLTSYSFDLIPSTSEWLRDNEVISLGNNILRLRKNNRTLLDEQLYLDDIISEIKNKILIIDKKIETLTLQKTSLNEEFDKKYSRFIQEGAWLSEDYTDDNLYYLDAVSTIGNSAKPKVQYTISVIEILGQPGFENYDFELGDVTHIQDTEFFGWTLLDGIKTPYKEKIVITEMTTNFDSPEKNTIKVQNYRSQFEDLFQRMAASTQKLEFQSGSYQRAAEAVDSNGSITSEALADVFSNNDLILKNTGNQSVTWDEKGITSINTQVPSEIIRITSGGFFVSDSGGKDWTTGITAKGINAKIITTGALNTELITILNGQQPAFRWDKNGITAYQQENGQYSGNTFVRFNQHGIYGIKNNITPLTSHDEIWENATFALTWKGFKLQSENKEDGYLSITNTSDLVVYGANDEILLQLGRIGRDKEKNVYGLAIGNQSNGNLPLSPDFQGLIATSDYLKIGGWDVDSNGLYGQGSASNTMVALYSQNQKIGHQIGESNLKNDWCIVAGASTVNSDGVATGANFGVDFFGNLYASNATISGTIYATGGIIGGLEIGPDPEDPSKQRLSIPVENIDGKIIATRMSILDKDDNLLFSADDGSTDEDPEIKDGEVYLSQWKVTAEGLEGKENDGISILLTPDSIIRKKNGQKDKEVSWSALLDKI